MIDQEKSPRAVPVAVIGMACRFPGADSPAAFWKNLLGGRNHVREIPADRWNWEAVFGDPSREANKTNSKWGGFLEGIDQFDPLFFKMSPAEANFIDPQHRLFLETAWRAIEDAGYRSQDLSGRCIGVYAGVSKNDYAELLGEDLPSFVSTGTVHSILANRVSFLLNLRGPSVPIDTACSSALVALHYAMRDLQDGSCEAALVGGVNALLSPRMYVSHAKSGMLSPEGRCKTFDAGADGYVRGEGVGVVMLKPLADALRDRDRVHAVIRASAINHGGRANFLTAPNATAQSEVVLRALRAADIDPATIRAIEAHGTGTALGDPIEIEGLKQAFAARAEELGLPGSVGRCALGSVKTNIGHLESAAGMAGLIKAIHVVQQRQNPPLLHFNRLNPLIALEGSPFVIADGSETAEGESDIPWRAGVSGFGMGGVNAHVIVEAALPTQAETCREDLDRCFLFSARRGRLRMLLEAWQAFLGTAAARLLSAEDMAFTLAMGRDAYEERCAIIARTIPELSDRLAGFLAGVSDRACFGPETETQRADGAEISDFADAVAVARLWVQGAEVTAQRHRLNGRPVNLPGHPFIRRSCWFRPFPERAEAPDAAPSITIAAEDPELRDHRVQGMRHLPALAYLRRVADRAAAGQPVTISDVYWPQPLTIEDDATQVVLDFTMAAPEGGFLFRGAAEHCRGTVRTGANVAEGGGIAGDAASGRERLSLPEIYARLAGHGLVYGPGFQTITEIRLSGTTAEARIDRQAETHITGLWDAAFQAAALLSIRNGTSADRQFLPFHLDHLRLHGDLAGLEAIRVNQHATGSSEVLRFDISGYDRAGHCLVQFENFSKRAYARAAVAVAAPPDEELPLLLYRARFRPNPVTSVDSGAAPLLINAPPALHGRLTETYGTALVNIVLAEAESEAQLRAVLQVPGWERHPWLIFARAPGEADALDLLGLVKQLIAARPKQAVRLKYIGHGETIEDVAAIQSIAGLGRVVQIEQPRIGLESVLFREPLTVAALRAAAEAPTAGLHSVTYEEGARLEAVAEALAAPDSTERLPIRRGGVWVIAGGAGGLGRIIAPWLVTEFSAQIVLVGRRAEDDSIRALLTKLEAQGGTACYRQADCGDEAQVTAVMAELRETFGAIHAVVHAVGVIEDSFLLRKQPASFARVLDAKMAVAKALDRATEQDDLDLFLCVSSVAALMPNTGQGDYAMANTFLDHFMQERDRLAKAGQRRGISLSVNLPLLAEGGIAVGPREESQLWEEFGMRPLPSEATLRLCETAIGLATAGQGAQILGIAGDRRKIERHLKMPSTVEPVGDLAGWIARDLSVVLAEQFRQSPASFRTETPLRDFGLDSVAITQIGTRLAGLWGFRLNPLLFFQAETPGLLVAGLISQQKAALSQSFMAQGQTAGLQRSHALIDPDRSQPAAGLFRRHFTNQEFYMLDHVVEGLFNVPGACYLEMARQAGAWFRPERLVVELADTLWVRQLSSPGPGFDACIQLRGDGDRIAYEIYSEQASGEKIVHATGMLLYGEMKAPPGELALAAIRSRLPLSRSRAEVYAQIHREGLHVGPSFMPMTEISLSQAEALALLHLPDAIDASWDDYLLHPTLVTGMFQTALIHNRAQESEAAEFIPMAIGSLRIFAPVPRDCHVYSQRRGGTAGGDIVKFDITVTDLAGKIVLTMHDLTIKARKTVAIVQPSLVRGHARDDAELCLKECVAPVLGLAAQEIDSTTPFKEYGVNSLMIIDLNRRMEAVFGGGLSRTIFFECQTIAELAEHMLAEHADALGAALPSRPVQVPLSPVCPPVQAPARPAFMPAPRRTGEDRDGIAIIGMALRFPKAATPDAFWHLLTEGRDCIERLPADRPASLGAPWGGYLEGIDQFDPLFFNITPREAAEIDPQERLFLQTAWHALEEAGYTRSALSARKVGVFVGALWQPYLELGLQARAAGHKVAPSSLLYSIANRVSYVCDFHGPSLAVDTACSSSLTALHLACQSLDLGESDVALAGGVNLSLGASKQAFLSQNGFLSSDGRCRSFGEGGDGYVPGEGVAAVVLQPLAAARAAGRQIHGVIRATAVNHGGRTHGYTVPNPRAQAALIQEVLHRAGISPDTISYLEAHGTGTELGDPIEIAALTEAFRGSEGRCAIGSVKSNFGHLEAAAGLAGLIKVLLQMRHGTLVPSLHSSTTNPHIDFTRTPFRVQQSSAPWQHPVVKGVSQPRRAGVSSFGAGGANSHVILEEAPAALAFPFEATPVIVPLSARDADRLRAAAQQLRDALEGMAPEVLPRLAYTLQCGREAFESRAAFAVASLDALRDQLDRFLATPPVSAATVDLAAGSHPLLQLLRRDGEMAALVAQWIKTGAWTKLADAWRLGVDVDWSQCWPEPPGILSLPGYPFAQERHWLPVGEAPAMTGGQGRLHPLLHQNVSRPGGQRYRSLFTPEDAVFADHIVQGRALLPGAAYLELAYAAAQDSRPAGPGICIDLSDIQWLRPCAMKPGGVTLDIAIQPGPDGDTARFDIHGEEDGAPILLCRGRATWGDARQPEIGSWRASGTDRQEGAACYRLFAEHGLTYGPSHQRIDWVETQEGAVCVGLRPLTAATETLVPGILDAAFQATLLPLFAADPTAVPALPMAVARVVVHRPLRDAACAWIRASETGAPRVDIDILSAAGEVLVSLRGFETRQPAAASPSTTLLLPLWQSVSAPALDTDKARLSRQRLWVIDGTAAVRRWAEPLFMTSCAVACDAEGIADSEISAAAPDHILWEFTGTATSGAPHGGGRSRRSLLILQRLLQAGLAARRIEWTILVHAPAGPADPDIGASIALLRTAAAEQGRWSMRIIHLDPQHDAGDAALLHLQAEPLVAEWRRDHGAWLRQSLVLLAQPEAFDALPTGLREGGVYLVIGGAGGIGCAWSEDAIRRYRARIIWVGRRPCSAAIQTEIDRLGAIGPAPRYVMADACDADAMAKLRMQVLAWYGAIHGIIHSALVLDDARIETLTLAQFDAVMAAKAGTCQAMHRAFDAAPPELVLFFSSINAFAAPPGQGNYSAASRYADGFARQLAAAWPRTVVKTINWGFWGSLGVVATPAYRERMARIGFGSIEAAEGFAGLDRLLRSPYSQLGFVKAQANEATAAAFFASGAAGPVALGQIIATGPAVPIVEPPARLMPDRTADAALARLRGTIADFLGVAPEEIDQHGKFADFGMDAADLATLRARVTAALGLGQAGLAWNGETSLHEIAAMVATSAPEEDTATSAEAVLLSQQLVRALLREAGLWEHLPQDAPAYLRLWQETTRTLLADVEDMSAALLWPRWHALPQGDATPALPSRDQAYLQLLHQILPALTDILRGARRATDVLFPGGSMREVERVYKHNRVAQALNGALAETVVRRLRQHAAAEPGRPFRILEIGAGTGATSAPVFAALDAAGLVPECYVFTDLSPAFLTAAVDGAGRARPWLKIARLDIEADPWAQTLVPATSFDLVIATNVLHATRDIRRAVRHAKAFLRPGGLLLLHELTRADWLNHASFGLLAGWWEFEDRLRLPGSPLLSVSGWYDTLAQEGFHSIGPIAGQTPDLGQTVLVAVSDGAVLRSAPSRPGAAMTPVQPPRAVAWAEPMGADKLLDHVRQLVAEVTRIDHARLRVKDPFEAYGVDSIVRLSLHAELEKHFGDLPATLLFERPSIAEVAAYLSQHQPRLTMPVQETLPLTVPVMPQPSVMALPQPSAWDMPPDAIAIIGISGRYPRAPNLDALWQRLVAGENCATLAPASRWRRSGAAVHGGFIEDIDRFDHGLFRLSHAQASALAPEVRLFLEIAWETFESAGYGARRLQQSQRGPGEGTGVFVASMYHQSPLVASAGVAGENVTDWMIANRVSHYFDLSGPSIALNTACSGSLTALHLACESLRAGSCSMALAGGVNLTLLRSKYDFLRDLGLLSEGDASRSFGKGDGFLPGEGVGAVLLKPLTQAIADHDRIEAVIRGSHISHAGGRQSFYAPDPQAQAGLIGRTLQLAGVTGDSIGYVDAAANGSELADALEVIALTQGLASRGRAQPCAIGAVKSNLGHLEAASGMSQLAKVVLQLRHETLVPTLFATPANPHLRLEQSGLRIQTNLDPWPAEQDARGLPAPRRALVNSFGAGGAYAAVVLEESPQPRPGGGVAGPDLFILVGPDTAFLRRRLAQVQDLLTAGFDDADLPRLAATLRGLDSDAPARIALIADSTASLASALAQAQAMPDPAGHVLGDEARTPALAAQAKDWLAGGATPAGPPLPPLRLPPYPFDHAARFPLSPDAPEAADVFARILAGDLTEDEFAEMVQS